MPSNPVTSGLMLQLDAIPLGLSDAASVSSWAGSNSTPTAATYSGSTAPTYRTTALNGFPAVRFGGGTCGLKGTFSGWGAGGARTLLMLCGNFLDAGTDYAGVLVLNPASGNDYDSTAGSTINIGSSAASNRLNWQGSANNVDLIGAATSDANYAFVVPTGIGIIGYGMDATGTDLLGPLGIIRTYATSRTVATPTGFVFGQRFISSAAATTFGGKYDLGIGVIYNRRISTSEAADVGQWMAEAYGLHKRRPAVGEVYG